MNRKEVKGKKEVKKGVKDKLAGAIRHVLKPVRKGPPLDVSLPDDGDEHREDQVFVKVLRAGAGYGGRRKAGGYNGRC